MKRNDIVFKKGKKRIIEKFIQGCILIILVILTISMMSNVNSIQGNARVINYAGIIRGATQRVIKLEIAGQSNDDLIVYLDDIFDGLCMVEESMILRFYQISHIKIN